MKITPLIVGVHAVEKTPEGTRLPGHTGAVTLLQHGGHTFDVDTGARGTFPRTVEALRANGLGIDDIDILLLTHLHLDHAFNVSRFEKSRVIAWMHDWKDGETVRLPVVDGYEVIEGVSLLTTPGHAEEHFSVVVKADDGKTVVVAGDAINEGYYTTGQISAFAYDADLYRASAARILEIADEIIPGHGERFAVTRS